jgi:hypothetical protein
LTDLYVPLVEEVITPEQHGQYAHFGYDGHFDVDGRPLDPWGFPYRYAATNGTYELSTAGDDGQPGGVGINADLNSDDPPETPNGPTFGQLFWDPDPARRTRQFVLSLTIWGGIACGIYFLTVLSFELRASVSPTPSRPWARFAESLIVLFVVTVVFVVLMVTLGWAVDVHYLTQEPAPFVA